MAEIMKKDSMTEFLGKYTMKQLFLNIFSINNPIIVINQCFQYLISLKISLINLLTKYKNTNMFKEEIKLQKQQNSYVVDDSSSEESIQYEVKEILDRRIVRDEDGNIKIQFKVWWKDYSKAEATWEPSEHLENSQKKIDEYYRRSQDHPHERNMFYDVYCGKKNKITKKHKKKAKLHQNRSKMKQHEQNRQKKQNPLYKNLPIYNNDMDEASFEEQKNLDNQFQIVGAYQEDITFVVQLKDGNYMKIQGKTMRERYSAKLIQFYQSKIRREQHCQ